MPFTLSHPAAVLPLMRRPFVPAALVAGAVAPDLPYFLKVPVSAESWYEPFVNATFSHSLEGLLVGLSSVVLLVVIVKIMWRPICDLVPYRVYSKAAKEKRPRSWISFIIWFFVSALIGTMSHIAWDSLTHSGGKLVAGMPFLDESFTGEISIDRALQHASTLVGVILIAVWCLRRFRSNKISIEKISVSDRWKIKRMIFIIFLLLSSAAFAVISLLEVIGLEGLIGRELALSLAFTSATSFAFVVILTYAIAWHVYVFLRNRMSIH